MIIVMTTMKMNAILFIKIIVMILGAVMTIIRIMVNIIETITIILIIPTITILSGLPGTGKSTAAGYFREGARKRQFKIAHVQSRQGDEMVHYGMMSR